MVATDQAETLRKAIENLINAKLHDALARPGGRFFQSDPHRPFQ